MAVHAVLDADTAVEELYAAHWRSLVRLSVLLVRDIGTAEEVVQDAFVAMHGRWSRLREPDKALAYLRQTVVNRSRSALRHRAVVERHARRRATSPSSTSRAPTTDRWPRPAVTPCSTRCATLPDRQREVLALRYYLDLSEAEIADALGISTGAVKSHAVARRRRPADPPRQRPGGPPMNRHEPGPDTGHAPGTTSAGSCTTRSTASSRAPASTSIRARTAATRPPAPAAPGCSATFGAAVATAAVVAASPWSATTRAPRPTHRRPDRHAERDTPRPRSPATMPSTAPATDRTGATGDTVAAAVYFAGTRPRAWRSTGSSSASTRATRCGRRRTSSCAERPGRPRLPDPVARGRRDRLRLLRRDRRRRPDPGRRCPTQRCTTGRRR